MSAEVMISRSGFGVRRYSTATFLASTMLAFQMPGIIRGEVAILNRVEDWTVSEGATVKTPE